MRSQRQNDQDWVSQISHFVDDHLQLVRSGIACGIVGISLWLMRTSRHGKRILDLDTLPQSWIDRRLVLYGRFSWLNEQLYFYHEPFWIRLIRGRTEGRGFPIYLGLVIHDPNWRQSIVLPEYGLVRLHSRNQDKEVITIPLVGWQRTPLQCLLLERHWASSSLSFS